MLCLQTPQQKTQRPSLSLAAPQPSEGHFLKNNYIDILFKWIILNTFK
jgi:hypothetical protein